MENRPYIISVSGFDPSGGAGLLADIKTAEAMQVYGFGVCTANTIQTDDSFEACNWVSPSVIYSQLEVLLSRYKIEGVKIGIIENTDVLLEVVSRIRRYDAKIPIVLDPVLKASSGFSFHNNDCVFSEEILEQITVLTPNYQEIERLFKDLSIKDTLAKLQESTNVFLKGGHHPSEKGKDVLYLKNGTSIDFYPSAVKTYEKHGSGCVLASALISFLAKGSTIENACKEAKLYTESLLASNRTKLGYHLWK
ncbi:hydroxymethylpyrimidine/phosphomethylpyrimidine kinase [Joostella sp.]|uniref:hydroxymethylpyrimidine/phosphomethylpyrimidine kinase n=1 Tax=Joostella sp. TaxID=2231138 RepID=UPI003A92A008